MPQIGVQELIILGTLCLCLLAVFIGAVVAAIVIIQRTRS
jgi:hypothetical protein